MTELGSFRNNNAEKVPSDTTSSDFSPSLMHYYHANRVQPETLTEALSSRVKTMGDLLKYLSYVPIGVGSKTVEAVTQDLRMQLFHERGCVCEACLKRIEENEFDIHHANYYQPDDPRFLKVVCRPCHKLINWLTGAVDYFEEQTQRKSFTEGVVKQIKPEDRVDIDEEKTPAYLKLFRRKES